MAPQIRALLNDLKTLVLSHSTVHAVHIRGEESTATRGYLRMRLVLQSKDVVEVFVYLSEEGGVARLKITASTGSGAMERLSSDGIRLLITPS